MRITPEEVRRETLKRLIEKCVEILGGAICSCGERVHRSDCQLKKAIKMRALAAEAKSKLSETHSQVSS